MPSTQTPPITGAAIDPPAVRPPIDDAIVERAVPQAVRARLIELREQGYTMLLDIGAADYPKRTPRFDVVYHLLKLPIRKAGVQEIGTPQRFRLLCGVPADDPRVPSVCDLWRCADWAEREVYDLFGIRFDGHPDLRRIQMPNDWEGYPLRKDYPLRGPAREHSPRPAFALKSNVQAGTPPSGRTLEALQEAHQARAIGATGVTVSATSLTPEIVSRDGNAMVLSMGPQHPSTHGVLQIMLEIEGESIVKAEPEIGYLHTGIEKTAENLFWSQAQTAIERMDYLAPSSNALCYALAVEQLLGITETIPERAQQIRVLMAELTRVASHCVWLGTHGIDLGALSVFFYCFDLREDILDIQEAAGGARMHPNYIRVGGVNADLPEGNLDQLDALIEKFPGRMRDLRTLLQANPILQDRLINVGTLSAEEAVQWGLTGPSLRASGVAYDVRRAYPYCGYQNYAFDVPTRDDGDSYARFLVRLDEMEESMRIVSQVRKALRPGPIAIDDTKIVAPPKETIALSMEALIHHFKIMTEGFRVPPGDVYQAVEGPRGELAYYLVSDGENRPYRVRTRPPSLYNLQALKGMAPGNLIADLVVMIGSLDPVFGEVDR